MLAPDLTDAAWLNIDGSVEAIVRLVKEGVAQPKEHPAPMPPMGGAQLTDAEVQAVAAYVKSLSAD
jgi:mono/diheme cytochrome c family protein